MRTKVEDSSLSLSLSLSCSVPKNATEVTDVLGRPLPGDGVYWSSSINYLFYRRFLRWIPSRDVGSDCTRELLENNVVGEDRRVIYGILKRSTSKLVSEQCNFVFTTCANLSSQTLTSVEESRHPD